MAIKLPVGMGVGIPGNKTWDSIAAKPTDWRRHAVRKLLPRWWYGWQDLHVFPEFADHNANYFPMLYYCNAGFIDNHESRLRRCTDKLWFVGNEPERVDPRDERGNPKEFTSPQSFVGGMRYLRERYPDYKFAFPGCHWDDERWQYRGPNWIDEYLHLGGPLPDAWHIHMYRYDPDEFSDDLAGAVETLRRLASLPVILSEFSASPAPVAALIMDRAQSAINRREIIAAAWFSAYYELWGTTDLLDPDTGELTGIGNEWMRKRYTAMRPMKTWLPWVQR